MHIYEMSSRKQKRVVRATLTAEGNGAVDTLEVGKLIQLALEELLTGPKSLRTLLTLEQRSGDATFAVPVELSVDARSMFDAISATEVKIPTEDSFVVGAAVAACSARPWAPSSIVVGCHRGYVGRLSYERRDLKKRAGDNSTRLCLERDEAGEKLRTHQQIQ